MYLKNDIRLAKWIKKAPQNYEQNYVNALTVFNEKLYAGTWESGLLFEWNDEDAWVLRASPIGTPPNDEYEICSLAEFNDKLYGGTQPHGKLVEWNGSNAWVEKAPQFGEETFIYSLVVFNNKLYAGTYPHGKLYEWNGSNAWVEKAAQLGSETAVNALTVFNGKLYAGTYPHGKLYEWNGTDAWVEKAPQLGSETLIFSLVIFEDKLYGGGYATGKLLEWNGTDAWAEKAPQWTNRIWERILPGSWSEIAGYSALICEAINAVDHCFYYYYSGSWYKASDTPIKKISVAPDGTIYALDYVTGSPYVWTGSWTAVGGGGSWSEIAGYSALICEAINAVDHCFYYYYSGSWYKASDTPIKKISVAPDGTLYALDYVTGSPYVWTGSWTAVGGGGSWSEIAGYSATKFYTIDQDHLLWCCDSGTWSQVADTPIKKISVAPDGTLYALDYVSGSLLKWDYNYETIRSLVVFNETLFAGTYPHGKLLEWNGTDAWTEKARQLHDQIEILSLVVFNEKLYAGTAPDGMLFQLDYAREKATPPDTNLKIYVAPPKTVLDADTIGRYAITPTSYKLKLSQQNEKIAPRELEITVGREAPIVQFSRVIVTDYGEIIFNGYVERSISTTKDSRKYSCKGNEAALVGRFMPKISYANIMSLRSVLQNIFWCVNSYWPPGTPYTVIDSSKNIIRLRYKDTYVDIGEATPYIRRGFSTRPLTRYTTLAELQTYDDGYYIAPNKDVYIRSRDSNWYAVGGLFVEDLFETRCKMGSYHSWGFSAWNDMLGGLVCTELDEVATLIFKLAKRHAYYIVLRDDYNYTYFDLSVIGSRSTGITIYEKDLLDFEKTSPASPSIMAAIVRGGGYQFSSVMDGRNNSPLFRVQTFADTYKRDLGMLGSLASNYFSQQNAADTTVIKCLPAVARSLLPGDIITLKLDGEVAESLKIAQIDRSDGKTSIQLGGRIPGLTDIFQNRLSQNVYDEKSLYEVLPPYSKSVTFKPRDNGHTTCPPGELTIKFPEGVRGPEGKRFLALMDVSLNLEYASAAGYYPWKITVTVNGKSGDWGNMDEVAISTGLSSIDITDLLVEGDNTILIYAYYYDQFPLAHGGCSAGEMFPKIDWIEDEITWNGHPNVTANVSINFFRMCFI